MRTIVTTTVLFVAAMVAAAPPGTADDTCTDIEPAELELCLHEDTTGQDPECEDVPSSYQSESSIAVTQGEDTNPNLAAEAGGRESCTHTGFFDGYTEQLFVTAQTGGDLPASRTDVIWHESTFGCHINLFHSSPLGLHQESEACPGDTGPSNLGVPWGTLGPEANDDGEAALLTPACDRSLVEDVSACVWEANEGDDPTCAETGSQAARGTGVQATVGPGDEPAAQAGASGGTSCQNVFGNPFEFAGVFINADTGGPLPETHTDFWWYEFYTGQTLCFIGLGHTGPAGSPSYGMPCDPRVGPGELPVPWGELIPDDLETGPPAPAPAPGPDASDTRAACIGAVLTCVTGTVHANITCTIDAGIGRCDADNLWRFLGETATGTAGEMESVGSALMTWCPPDEFCRSIGVGFPYQSCRWDVGEPGCTREVDYTLRTGDVALDPGECLDVALTITGRGLAYFDQQGTLPFGAEVEPRAEAAGSVCA